MWRGMYRPIYTDFRVYGNLIIKCHQYYLEKYVFDPSVSLYIFKICDFFIKYSLDIHVGRRNVITGNLKITLLSVDSMKQPNALEKIVVNIMYWKRRRGRIIGCVRCHPHVNWEEWISDPQDSSQGNGSNKSLVKIKAVWENKPLINSDLDETVVEVCNIFLEGLRTWQSVMSFSVF